MSQEVTRKSSHKRNAILNVMQHTDEHPSVDAVHSLVRERYPDISLGTVYRNIGILQEEGLIKSIAVVDGQERFDADMSRHTHFICDTCGSIIDLDAGESFAQTESHARNRGFTVRRHELVVYGNCRACSRESKKQFV